MLDLRTSRRALLGATILLSILAARVHSRACSPAESGSQIRSGPLGFRPFVTVTSGDVPRNVAVVEPGWSFEQDAGALEWMLDATLRFSRPVELFDAGTTLNFSGSTFRVIDVVDSAPPTVPGLLSARSHGGGSSGVGCNRCGVVATYSIELVPAADDLTPTEHLSYLVFFGATAEEAQSNPLADGPFVPLGTTIGGGGGVGQSARRFVALAAVDQAGNTSARSPSLRAAH